MNPFSWLRRRTPIRANAEKLYGAIVAQARLPVFYEGVGVPDSLEGRLSLLAMHLFTVLKRLKTGAAAGLPGAREMAQELVDLFSADMDTVLREMGVSDLKVPKRVRDLCAKTHGQINWLEEGYDAGPQAFRTAIAEQLPMPEHEAAAASAPLSSYLKSVLSALEAQDWTALVEGKAAFPETPLLSSEIPDV